MPASSSDFLRILRQLADEKVDFIVVGGVGAALYGVAIPTFDLDIVHSRRPGNVKRLATALKKLDAHYRERADRHLTPSIAALKGPGHHLLITRNGPLDVLGEIVGHRAYDDLLPHTEQFAIGSKLLVRVLDLNTLIQVKEKLGRDKDLAALPVLRSALRERRQSGG